ncbi:uncharacterized protein JN550_006814, partial [Neoarthrinium moseri]|uniref:uncharacterized protein n=1 Tax=Neoarthrinium moseri TaxID=1658444 RepID=UPI001FDC013D
MKSYSEQDLQEAIAAIANGAGIKESSREFGIPKSTLQNRIRGHQPRSEAFANQQRLLPSQEEWLSTWILAQDALGLAPTHAQVREFAERVLHAQGDTQPLGKRWLQGFLRRNPNILTQRSIPIDSKRVNGATVEVIRPWFNHLHVPLVKAIKPANRYNMDEAGLLEGVGTNGLVLGSAQKRSIRKKQPGSRAWTSFIECISAHGRALPPLVIFKGKSVQQQWFPIDLKDYKDWHFTVTDNGWISNPTAVEWLQKVFIPNTTPDNPKDFRLLIMDGYGSHTATEFMYQCYSHRILL